jgi:flagellar biosynthesis/type III secretory pathway protein FliH
MDKTIQGKHTKYFFNQNIFDENHVEEPLPPAFSEKELEAAKLKAVAEGKNQGLKEAENSQLKLTAQILDKIQKQLAQLAAAEALREQMFEREILQVCLAVFERLFPVYNERAGFEELKTSITEIIKQQEGQNHVVVSVTPDVVAAIETHLNGMKDSGLDIKFAVRGDETLAPGACRLAWNDGGALRDPQRLADEIRTSLEQVLAKNGPKGHDEGKGESA